MAIDVMYIWHASCCASYRGQPPSLLPIFAIVCVHSAILYCSSYTSYKQEQALLVA